MQVTWNGKVWGVKIGRNTDNEAEILLHTPDWSERKTVTIPKGNYPQQAATLGNDPKILFIGSSAFEALASFKLLRKCCYVSGTGGNVVVAELLADLPLYVHDCNGCEYLGTHAADDRKADLYFCKQEGSMPTIIARYSDEGPDYSSGIWFADVNPLIGEGKRRAIEKGLYAK